MTPLAVPEAFMMSRYSSACMLTELHVFLVGRQYCELRKLTLLKSGNRIMRGQDVLVTGTEKIKSVNVGDVFVPSKSHSGRGCHATRVV